MSTTLALLGGKPEVTDTTDFSWPPITDDDVKEVVRLMRANELSYYGREGEVRNLEDHFCQYLGVEYGLATSSGTTALHSAFFALGLEPGSEILAPTYTFLATVMPIFVVNAVPVLVDADPTNGNVDPDDIERHITTKTKAIVVTHMWGMPCDMARIAEIAQRHGLLLVEDCSHAPGAVSAGKKVGSWGDVAIFSLQAKKLVAAGQGGILVTKHREMYERATLLGHFKVRSLQEVQTEEYRRFAETGFGLNYRMHPLAAAIANVQFTHLEEYIQGRRDNFVYLNEKLTGFPGLIVPQEQPGDRHVYYSYKFAYLADACGIPVDLFVEALRAEGVDISRSKTLPLHQEAVFQSQRTPMKCYDNHPRLVYSAGDLPNSELYASRALSLTEYTTPVKALLDQYVLAVEKVIENARALIDYGNRRGGA